MALASYLFGVKPVDDSQARADAEAQRKLAAAYAAREGNAYAGQERLAQNLWSAVNGTGPSVAGTQLQAGLDQTLANGNSMASGGSGANGALARYAAILGAGRAGAATNQQAAELAAQQTAQARAQLGGVTGAMAGESGGLEQSSNANDLAALGLASNIDEQNNKTNAAVAGTLISGAAGLGSAGLIGLGGAGPAAALAPTAAATTANLYSPQPSMQLQQPTLGTGPSYGSIYDVTSAPGTPKPEDDGYSGGPYGSSSGYGNPYGDRY